MDRNWALIDPQGRLVGKINVFPVELKYGQRLSVRSYHSIKKPVKNFKFKLGKNHIHGAGFEVEIEVSEYSDNTMAVLYEAVGTNLDEIRKIIEYFDHLSGAVDHDVHFYRRIMPDIKGFWKRVKFLFWDFLIHGDTEPKYIVK